MGAVGRMWRTGRACRWACRGGGPAGVGESAGVVSLLGLVRLPGSVSLAGVGEQGPGYRRPLARRTRRVAVHQIRPALTAY
jgi:hypothetical protein